MTDASIRERAERLVCALVWGNDESFREHLPTRPDWQAMILQTETALRAERDAALEHAAKLSDGVATLMEVPPSTPELARHAETFRRLSETIRAAKGADAYKSARDANADIADHQVPAIERYITRRIALEVAAVVEDLTAKYRTQIARIRCDSSAPFIPYPPDPDAAALLKAHVDEALAPFVATIEAMLEIPRNSWYTRTGNPSLCCYTEDIWERQNALKALLAPSDWLERHDAAVRELAFAEGKLHGCTEAMQQMNATYEAEKAEVAARVIKAKADELRIAADAFETVGEKETAIAFRNRAWAWDGMPEPRNEAALASREGAK